MLFSRHKTEMVTPEQALPGRSASPLEVPARHYGLDAPLGPPDPDGPAVGDFGPGGVWGAERKFWGVDGVYPRAVGYQGGLSPNPTYEEGCTAKTGHAEIVKVVFDPAKVSYRDLLKVFWEAHDPTQ